MTLYDIYKYTPKEIKEIEILIDQVFKLGIEEEVQESFFQFSPSLIMDKKKQIPGFGEHKTWFSFHKKSIITEIIVYLIESTTEYEYVQEKMINDLIWIGKYKDFLDIIDITKLSKKEIIEAFKKYLNN